jgi:hypothetical protein
MASPLSLGLAAALALCSTTALACEGQGCWGMAPAQEKNPGYTGPDYAALYGPDGPPPVYGYGYSAGDSYGYADEGYGADGHLPYAGPLEGYPEPYQNADGSGQAYAEDEGYGYGPEDGSYGPPPGYADDAPGYDVPPVGGGGSGPHGPPQDPYAGAYMYDAPPVGGGGSGPHGPPEGPYAGASAYGAPPPVGSGPHGPPPPVYSAGPAYGPGEPYEGYSSGGYEAYGETPYDTSGYRERSYRAGSKSRYVYDSGWRIEEGPSIGYGSGGYPSGSPMYGPAYRSAPGTTSERSHHWSQHQFSGAGAGHVMATQPPMAVARPAPAPPPPAAYPMAAPPSAGPGMPARPVPYDQLDEPYDGPSMDRTGERG